MNDDGVTNHCNWNSIITNIKGVDIAQAMLDIAAKPGFKNCVQDDFIAGYRTEVLLPVSADAGMQQKSRNYGAMIMVL